MESWLRPSDGWHGKKKNEERQMRQEPVIAFPKKRQQAEQAEQCQASPRSPVGRAQ
jgi:hypothetical protein